MRNKKIIVALSGGLGNQFFQYAFGRMLQERFGCDLEFDTSFYRKHPEWSIQIDKYNIPKVTFKDHKVYSKIRLLVQRIPVIRWLVGTYKENQEFVLDNNVFKHRYAFYCGYWQNYRYFEDIEDKLKEELQFKGSISPQVQELAEKMQNEPSIAVHVRRGDFLNEEYKSVYYILNEDYYRRAIEEAKTHICNRFGQDSTINVFFFSNDIEWCKQTYGDIPNAIFVDSKISESEHTDLYLMRHTNRLVMANSTFGWWAGNMMNSQEHKVICPNTWYVDCGKNTIAREALLEPSWILNE